MKIILALLLLLCGITGYGQVSSDIIYLKNGTAMRGDIVEVVPGSHVKFVDAEYGVWTIQMANVDSVSQGIITAKVPPSGPFDYGSKTKGFYFDMRFGMMAGSGPFGGVVSSTSSYVYGWKINEKYGLGIGLAWERVNRHGTLPLFLEGRYELSKGNLRPYALAYGGWALAATNNSWRRFKGGIMGGVEIGMRNQIGSHAAVIFGIGYRYMHYRSESREWNFNGVQEQTITTLEILNANRLCVRLGFIFN